MKKLTFAAASALALVLAAPMVAFAHGHRGGGDRLEQLDTNADGNVSRAEAETAALAAFTEIDTSGDGFLTQEELKSGHDAKRAERVAKWAEKSGGKEPRAPRGERDPAKMEAKAAERFAAVDTDSDGRWNPAEFAAHRLEHFTKLDTSGDGNISAEERAAAKASMKERRGKWRDKPAGQ